MDRDLLEEIKAKLPSLSNRQKIIGNFICEHYDKAAYATATKLAEMANVSEPTVVRFAFSMGFDGFPELQKELRNIIRTRLTAIQRIEITNDLIGKSDVLNSVIGSDIEKLRSTLETISHQSFNKAVEMFSKANEIYIIGSRTSSVIAQFFGFNLNLIFEKVHTIHNVGGTELIERMISIKKGDLVFAVSFPRYSKSIIDAVAFAKSNDADVIGLTDTDDSPIARYSDILLTAKSDMAAFVDSLTAPLSVVNALIVAISAHEKQRVGKTFEKLEKIWIDRNYYKDDEK